MENPYVKYSVERGQAIIALLETRIGLQNKKILDVGCGDGGVAVAFARAGCKVTAIDAEMSAIVSLTARAQKEDLPITVIHGNIEEFEEGVSFDGALLVDSSEYFSDPEKVFKILGRVIRKEGFCYIAVLNRLFWWSRMRQPKHKRFYFYHELRKMLRKNGFHVTLLREELLKKINRWEQIEIPWRRRVVRIFQKCRLQRALVWWIKSPLAPYFEAYWKMLAIKVR